MQKSSSRQLQPGGSYRWYNYHQLQSLKEESPIKILRSRAHLSNSTQGVSKRRISRAVEHYCFSSGSVQEHLTLKAWNLRYIGRYFQHRMVLKFFFPRLFKANPSSQAPRPQLVGKGWGFEDTSYFSFLLSPCLHFQDSFLTFYFQSRPLNKIEARNTVNQHL